MRNNPESHLIKQREFTSEVVGKFFSACSHEEGTNMKAYDNMTFAGYTTIKGVKHMVFQYPVYDDNEEQWFVAEAYFAFGYSGTPIAGMFDTKEEAIAALKGKHI